MKKIFLILSCIYLIWVSVGLSEEIEIDSKIIVVNPEHEFFVIKGGENEGIEIGDGVIVHRDYEKIAEAHIIEVRPDISAAEILNIEEGQRIEKDDDILIVKEPKEVHKELIKRPKEPKSNDLLKTSPKTSKALPSEIKSSKKEAYIAGEKDVISITINRDSKAVFSYARLVLRENGFSITSSDKSTGILLATKPIALSLFSELWADAFAAIDHRLVVSFEIKSDASVSIIKVSSFKEHTQKRKHIKSIVKKNSKFYKELTELLSKIKRRSEY